MINRVGLEWPAFLYNLNLEDYKKEGLEKALIAPQFPFFLP